ncbi:MAG: galactokinase, partial [Pirellulales bacterium]|nr:galactokinase [Pirellulales bacterium]
MPSQGPKPAAQNPLAKTPIARTAVEKFIEIFGQSPEFLVRAPGRVNLIGEHTDYNDGFVMPLAIDRAVWIALRRRDDRRVSVYSLDFDSHEEFSLDNLTKGEHGWCEYIKGVAHFLSKSLDENNAKLRGWEGVLTGDVPLGAGLSSSASLEVAAARAFAAVSDIHWEPAPMAKLAQKAENQWIGMNCGIMDQLVSTSGIDGHAILIDCRSLETTPVPFPENLSVVILDTGTRRGLVDSAYNQRRAHCEETAEFFSVKALRDVDLKRFEQNQDSLDETTRRRARHVITENDRTLQAVDAMREGQVERLGLLMDQSHDSLRDDFEVTNDALCAMVEIARRQPG